MLNALNVFVTDASDVEVTNLAWSGVQPGTPTDPVTLRLYSGEVSTGTTVNLLTVVRGDLMHDNPAGEDDYIARTTGSEVLADSWLEARAGISGAWTALDGWTSSLDLGAIAAGDFATFQVRLNPPSNALSMGTVSFNLAVRSQ